MTEATFTFRVDDALKQAFTVAAKGRDRSGAQLLRDFMREVVRQQHEAGEHDAWFRREVQAALDDTDAGQWVSAEAVEIEAAVWRAETEGRLAGIAQ